MTRLSSFTLRIWFYDPTNIIISHDLTLQVKLLGDDLCRVVQEGGGVATSVI
jgi:hypothetical protein